jgi:hypothetical protein
MISVNNLNRKLRLALLVVLVLIITFAIFIVSTHAQTGPTANRAQANQPVASDIPVFNNYRGAAIGMSADLVHQKLGLPTEPGAQQDFYFFSEKESAQVFYDRAQNVRAISITYMGEGAPTVQQVLGVDVLPNPDGSLSRLVHYERAGYWVAYNLSAGPAPVVTITVQQIVGR